MTHQNYIDRMAEEHMESTRGKPFAIPPELMPFYGQRPNLYLYFMAYKAGLTKGLDLALKLEAEMKHTDKYLEGISNGSELGTDAVRAAVNAKRYAYQIQVEIRKALAEFQKEVGKE